METKHTKGEWIVNKRVAGVEVAIHSETGTRICEVKSYPSRSFNDPTTKTANYNAKLIAAAPDLLDALIMAKHEIETNGGVTPRTHLMPTIESAIQKATS